MSRSELESLPNIGPRLAKALNRIGVVTVTQLQSKDPHHVHDELGRIDERYRDPCVLDTLEAVIDHLNGSPPVPWWVYSRRRKAQAALPAGPGETTRAGRVARFTHCRAP